MGSSKKTRPPRYVRRSSSNGYGGSFGQEHRDFEDGSAVVNG
jgi:hypothetical protein